MYFYILHETNMNLRRINGIVTQELYMSYQSIEIIVDLAVFPVMSIIVFGFLSKYLAGVQSPTLGNSVLVGMILWQYIWIVQYTVTLGSMWNIWSRNLSNLFVSPLTVREYIFAHVMSGIIKGLVILILSSIMSSYVFGFNILSMGYEYLVLSVISLGLFAMSIGISVLGLIFRYGTRIQALAWGFLPFFQPLTAAFYPVNVLPESLRIVAYALPPTYVFEAGRKVLNENYVPYEYFATSFLINGVFILCSLAFFSYMFKKSKESGQFARNEG